MYALVTILILITCVLIVLIVLVQNPKGGGLASAFQSSNQIMGVRKTADFLEKATWSLAVALLVLSLLSSMTVNRESKDVKESVLKEQIDNYSDAAKTPQMPSANQNQGQKPATGKTQPKK